MKACPLAQLITSLLPFALAITPHTYAAEDGETYYYVTYRLPGQVLPFQTEPEPSPILAYNYARHAILHDIKTIATN